MTWLMWNLRTHTTDMTINVLIIDKDQWRTPDKIKVRRRKIFSESPGGFFDYPNGNQGISENSLLIQ